MKIAVCFSGQVRTWKYCYQNWIDNLSPLGEVDYFCHFWDYNSVPEEVLLDAEEKQDIIDTLNPKKIIFESRKLIKYWNSNIPIDKQFCPESCDQFYSVYYSSLLKREYELENNFRYDIVLQFRPDQCFSEPVQIATPVPNTIYTSHCEWDHEYAAHRVSDIFFYGDSHTIDQISEFFKFLSFIPTNWVTYTNCPPSEIAFYYYMTNIGILNHPTNISMKIMRDSRVKEITGQFNSYEIVK
jgi:hypothetical protein